MTTNRLPRRRGSYSTQAVPDPDRFQEIEYCGFLLLKKPKKFLRSQQRWLMRYCILTSNNLYYYQTPNSHGADRGSGLIPMSTVVRMKNKTKKGQSDDALPICELRLTTRRRKVFRLRFAFPDEQLRWSEALMKHVHEINLAFDKVNRTRTRALPRSILYDGEEIPMIDDADHTINQGNVLINQSMKGVPFNNSNVKSDDEETISDGFKQRTKFLNSFEDQSGQSKHDQSVENMGLMATFTGDTKKQQDPEIQTDAFFSPTIPKEMKVESFSDGKPSAKYSKPTVAELIQYYNDYFDQKAKKI